MSNSMIERVAKALSVADGMHPDAASNDEDETPMWTLYVKDARAAIEAMREPTDEMKSCSEDVHWGYSCHVCGGLKEGWQKMIDAALSTPDEK